MTMFSTTTVLLEDKPTKTRVPDYDNATSQLGGAALHLAVINGHVEIVKFQLLKNRNIFK